LKGLALFKCINIKGCFEKDEIIAALRAGGVSDADAPAAAAPAAPKASPPALPKGASSGVKAALGTDGEATETDDEMATASAANAASAASDVPEKKGLKFFQLKKTQREAVIKSVAERKAPEPSLPDVWKEAMAAAAKPAFPGGPSPKIVERPPGADLQPLSLAELKELAKDREVSLDGCLDKEDVIAALVAKGIVDNRPKPKVIPPPPKKAGAPPPAVVIPQSPQEYYFQKQRETQEKWQKTLACFKNFLPKFNRGDKWEIHAGFPLWTHEDSDEKAGYMQATTHVGHRNVIEIAVVGKTRLRVRATRWNPIARCLIGVDPSGWMDVYMVTDEETGKLLMRPYDAHGMYVETDTGHEPVLMQRTLVEQRLQIDPEIGAGLHLTCTPAGMQVDDIDAKPGQPGLAVGDLIVGIGGTNLVNLPGKQAVEDAFKAAFVDGAQLEVAA
jgi:hypothetical protein